MIEGVTREAITLPVLSATQIQLWLDCKRKWAFKHIAGIQTPTHPAAALGTEVQDTQLDPYLSDGRAFDFSRPSGEIAQALTPLLPKSSSPGMRLRRKFLVPSPTGQWWYQGEFDMYAPDSGIMPGFAGGRVLVQDTKTTGNLAYALTAETLATNIQAQLYAFVVMFEESVNELDLAWAYVRTRKPHRTKLTHLPVYGDRDVYRIDGSLESISTDHVVQEFKRIEAAAKELVAVKLTSPKPEDVPPNPRMCDSYGGCPYRHLCNLSPAAHHAAITQEANLNMNAASLSFLDALKKGVAAGVPVAPLPAPAPAPVPVPVAAPAPVAPPVIATAAAAQAAGLPPSLTTPVAYAYAPPPGVAVTAPGQVNPPEAALPPAPPVGISAATDVAPKKRGRPSAAEVAARGTVTNAVNSAPAAVEDMPLDEAFALASAMRSQGIKRIRFVSGFEIEVQP